MVYVLSLLLCPGHLTLLSPELRMLSGDIVCLVLFMSWSVSSLPSGNVFDNMLLECSIGSVLLSLFLDCILVSLGSALLCWLLNTKMHLFHS